MVEHQGAASVSSELGKGSEFTLWLPIAAVAEAAPVAVGTPAPRSTILLVDDEPLLLAASARLLRSMGYDVVTATDGLQALDRLAESPEKPIAVVSDVAMPRLDGFQLLARIREQGLGVPVILTSGYPRDHEMSDLGVEPDAFVSKPFRRSELAAKLEQLTGPRG